MKHGVNNKLYHVNICWRPSLNYVSFYGYCVKYGYSCILKELSIDSCTQLLTKWFLTQFLQVNPRVMTLQLKSPSKLYCHFTSESLNLLNITLNCRWPNFMTGFHFGTWLQDVHVNYLSISSHSANRTSSAVAPRPSQHSPPPFPRPVSLSTSRRVSKVTTHSLSLTCLSAGLGGVTLQKGDKEGAG